ncbi:hypothetical protein ACLOJK_036797 [Asimina triloba]
MEMISVGHYPDLTMAATESSSDYLFIRLADRQQGMATRIGGPPEAATHITPLPWHPTDALASVRSHVQRSKHRPIKVGPIQNPKIPEDGIRSSPCFSETRC